LRLVITGIGPVTPIGIGVDAFWENLCAGRSGVRPITAFDASEMKVQIAADVPDFEPERFMDAKSARRMARFAQMAVAAAQLARADAGLDLATVDLERVASVVNTGGGGVTTIAEETRALARRGAGRVGALFVPMMAANMASCQVSMELGLQGPAITGTAACASSIYSFIEAKQIIQYGEADVMVTGGTEATVTEMSIAGFSAARALATGDSAPEEASRPFDAQRNGFVLGEGAGALILEEYEHARARGAQILGEFLGLGFTADAHHMTDMAPGGKGSARAMNIALRDAGMRAEQVGYVNAHGTSTVAGDRLETEALKSVFGEHARTLAVSSTKSMTGHLLGAAGAIESIACVMALQRGVLPPTINYEHLDPACDLDYVPNQARQAPIQVAMNNSFGFGGHNVALLFGRAA